jgi:4-hydroxymandelate oxidase
MAAPDPLNVFTTLKRLRGHKSIREAYDYFAGGAGDELTVAENCRAFQRLATALNRLGHPEGEVAVARAAGAAGSAMVLSTTASSTIEEVATAASGDQ